MAAVRVSHVPSVAQIPDDNTVLDASPSFFKPGDGITHPFKKDPKFLVIGHRGNGMNVMQSSDPRMKAVKENTIRSFNTASKYSLDFIEFDVQVTHDGCPIIFHDDFIYSEDNGTVHGKRVTELSLSEFLSYGPQRGCNAEGKTVLRKMEDGKTVNWTVEYDDCMCTLQEAFQEVNPSLGFNIELKFDDNAIYQQEHLTQVLEAILKVVFEHAKERSIIFSTFHPDAALLVRKLQSTYPVFFLTDGGTEVYRDARRNSLEEAIKVCMEGGLQGIVSEARSVFRSPGAVKKSKDLNLCFLTYGKLNNVGEAVYIQHLMGVDGVIVDLVKEVTEAVERMVKTGPAEEEEEEKEEGGATLGDGDGDHHHRVHLGDGGRPQFSSKELAFLLKLIPELLRH